MLACYWSFPFNSRIWQNVRVIDPWTGQTEGYRDRMNHFPMRSDIIRGAAQYYAHIEITSYQYQGSSYRKVIP
jgi:hypothetical protein